MRLNGLNILIIEDEPLLAEEIFGELLSFGAVPIGPAASISGAFQYLQEDAQINGAFINTYLRGELSFPVADALIDRNIPFIFVTGSDEIARQKYPNAYFHTKPSNIPKLIEELSALMTGQ